MRPDGLLEKLGDSNRCVHILRRVQGLAPVNACACSLVSPKGGFSVVSPRGGDVVGKKPVFAQGVETLKIETDI
jgi:hypothetical protein